MHTVITPLGTLQPRSLTLLDTAADVPVFARGGDFVRLVDPFRGPIAIASAGAGAVRLATSIHVAYDAPSVVPVHWEIARDVAFRAPERYGLLLAHAHEGFAVQLDLDGLERGRFYWARLWAGGSWSRSVRVRTGPRANGSAALSLTLARRLHSKAS